ncbi:MAG TPA: (2Fe-2S)-binding protein [Xanthobacteraceae bacterium]|nr:(2Fe-2S)-binding protein [Xanthobacteraceae bacterium]
MADELSIALTVNGERIERDVKARQSLADFLREELALTGTHLGCEHGVCGACSVVIDGDVVRSCLTLAAQVNGKTVETIEGLSDRGALKKLQAAFLRYNAAQCGFCTPGMLVIAHDMISRGEAGDRDEIRDYISGNFCRCTGYQAIVNAIESVAKEEKAGVA